MFSRPVQMFLWTWVCFGQARLWRLVAKAQVCLCWLLPSWFKSSNASQNIHPCGCAKMTFDPLATVQFHSKLALQAGFHVPQEEFHKNLKWFLEGNYCRIAERVLDPKSEWDWTFANGSKVIVAHRRMRSLRPRCQLEPKPLDFHESNEIKSKSLSARAAEVELNQNKKRSQKKLYPSWKHQGGKVVCNKQ